ncbi:hypothetical protein TRFO_07637 [Tritrichomonas foetus]|uniref:Uncharacterized protein n=1 Tax=Tritrichomonas foetus TaxID=1144522 RepID=A0A1J4JQE4_9EUKA|nr:hypothetical protein TRFO_07637 [Tritrichomonas foetus]|eukprot:OHT01383.1 hypothetical protein TRFO_07637 [Tritrichomonas foetus]
MEESAPTNNNDSEAEHTQREHTPDACGTQNDPLLSIMSNSQYDSIYQNTNFPHTQSENPSQMSQLSQMSQMSQQNTQNFEQQNDPIMIEHLDEEEDIARQKTLAEVTRRLTEAAAFLEDPNNEGDEYYSTVWAIYTFFGHKKSIMTVLNAIHLSGGDVNLAVKRLARMKDRNESSVFAFKDVIAPNATTERYFKY